MSLPTVTQTWTTSVNNRAAFSTVIDAMQSYAFSLKAFLKTTMGYTTKGSCTAGTGAMDGTDRWSSKTDVTPRATTAGASQAWFVFTDGNGIDYAMCFQGASDDVFRFSYSPGGLFVAAGTANNQPTATDEAVVVSGTTIVNATASGDRVWHMWGTSDKKMFRAANFRSNALNSFVGVERLTSKVLSPCTFSPAVWGFFYNTINVSNVMGAFASTNGGIARVTVPTSTGLSTANFSMGGGGENFGSVGGSTGTWWGVEKPELQGANGGLIIPLTVCSQTSGQCGKLGDRIDWWTVVSTSSAVPTHADTYGLSPDATLALVAVGQTLHPWDGASTMQAT